MNLPNMPSPCGNCPFRKDCTKGWLGRERMEEILAADSFTCHKTTDAQNRLQCAGHMLIKGNANAFVELAQRLRIDLKLIGRELVFDTEQECIDHHQQRGRRGELLRQLQETRTER